MTYIHETLELTHTAALEMLSAAIAAAESIDQPQCIVIVDKSGETLASIRMTGAKFLSKDLCITILDSFNLRDLILF